MEEKKPFGKIEFLDSVGFLRRRFNAENGQFERSVYMNLKANLIMVLKVIILWKVYISTWFERRDIIQLYIGNLSVK